MSSSEGNMKLGGWFLESLSLDLLHLILLSRGGSIIFLEGSANFNFPLKRNIIVISEGKPHLRVIQALLKRV